MSATFKGEHKHVKLGVIQTFSNWKCKQNMGVAVGPVIQYGYKLLWELISWASTALRQKWGRRGDHNSGYIFQSHHRSSDKINLGWSSLIFPSVLTCYRNTAPSPPRKVQGFSSKKWEDLDPGLPFDLNGDLKTLLTVVGVFPPQAVFHNPDQPLGGCTG